MQRRGWRECPLLPLCVHVAAGGRWVRVQAVGGLALQVAGTRWSARADRAVSQPKPLMMLARWNSPPRWTSRGDWPKPAAASAMVAGMVTAVAAL